MIDASIPLQFRGFDAGAAMQNAQQMKLRDMMMQQQQEKFEFEKQQYAAQQEAASEEQRQKRVMTLARIANGVNAENYASRRQAAIAWGIPETDLPPAYPGDDWAAQQQAILSIVSDPPKMTAKMQEAMAITGLPIDHPTTQAKLQELLSPPRFMSVEPGGSVYVGNPSTNSVAPAILPNDGSHAPGSSAGGGIPQEAIDALLRGEGTDAQFDDWFGQGAAARVRGGSSGNAGGGFPGN